MQKARRFLHSTASQSSPSNTTIRTCKKSRTSSAGGDSLGVSRDVGTFGGGIFQTKTNNRATKCSVRPVAKNAKNLRKESKFSKAPKLNFGSLQNAVVLAPFHTLKRCFQNKLVDLYTYEKMKKMNQKAKMAKKRNMSFEYDVVEMKTLGTRVKKVAQEGKSNLKQKSRSPSYCQCKKIGSKAEQKLQVASNKTAKASLKHILPSRPPSFSGRSEAKTRKLDREMTMASNLKSELSPRIGFYPLQDRFHFSDANQSSSAISSPSKCDSWETYSNPQSCKEEHIHGSLAVSTTSFDSYLENFERGSWDLAQSSKKNNKKNCRKPQGPVDPDFLPKPTAQFSRHLIMEGDRKVSDGEIVDFMDREPKSQMVRSVESSQQWQPLRMQSKTRYKKPEEESAAGYNLRSHSTGLHKERDLRRESRSHVHKRGSSRGLKSFQIEVATQVGGNASENGSKANSFDGSPREPPPEAQNNQEQNPDNSSSYLKVPSSGSKTRSLPEELPTDLNSSSAVQFVEDKKVELEPSILGERSDVPSMEDKAFGEPIDLQQQQEEESNFIYRAISNGNTLEESCEFRFNLN